MTIILTLLIVILFISYIYHYAEHKKYERKYHNAYKWLRDQSELTDEINPDLDIKALCKALDKYISICEGKSKESKIDALYDIKEILFKDYKRMKDNAYYWKPNYY